MAEFRRISKRARARARRRKVRREIMEAIIYFGSENQKLLPANEKYILSAIISGTVEYLTGQKSFFHYGVVEDWESNIHEKFKGLLGNKAKKLDSAIEKTLIYFSDYERRVNKFVGGYEACFCNLFKTFSYRPDRPLLFIIPEDFLIGVERKVLPLFPQKRKMQCREIGLRMYTYVKKDVEKIQNSRATHSPE